MKLVFGRLFLVIALLAGWQAALVHPIEHVDDGGALVHFGDSGGEHGTAAGELCDLLASLSACAAWGGPTIAVAASIDSVSVAPRFEPRRAQAPPFLAQGPPPFL